MIHSIPPIAFPLLNSLAFATLIELTDTSNHPSASPQMVHDSKGYARQILYTGSEFLIKPSKPP